MRYLKLILLILLFAGCEEYFVPNVGTVQPVYTFEGYVTDQPGPYCVKIMKSSGYNAKKQLGFVPDAIVTIECQNGQSYSLTYDSAGCYYTDSAAFVGKVGNSYRLKVETADGKMFESEYDQMPACPEIEELTAQYYQRKIVTYDGNYYHDEIERGLQVLNTTYAYGHTPYYRYDCKLILQSQQRYSSPPMLFDRYIFRPVSSYGNLYITNAKDYVGQYIKGNQLQCTTTKTLLHYSDLSLIEGMEFDVTNCGEYVRVTQYSMTEAQYKYWFAIKYQLENKNYLFGQMEYQVVGNIKCISNPDETALGFFGASAAKSRIRAFTVHENSQKVFTYDIKSFPDTDTTVVYESYQRFSTTFE